MGVPEWAVSDPDKLVMTCREELEMKGVWESYKKYYKVDPDIDMEEPIYIHADNAARIGLL